MNKILIIFSLFLLAACGPSQEEKQNIAQNACSIMGETKKSDSLFRTQTMIDAREKIGGGAFVRGDDAIIEAFEFGVCQQLVLNESYDEILQPLKDAKQERERIAAERQAEQERIAAEKRAEEQRIADSKPTVKEEFFSNGQLKSRTNYQPKSEGGKEDGGYEEFSEKGHLTTKGNYKDGERVGTWEIYARMDTESYPNGQLKYRTIYKDGGNAYIEEEWNFKNVLIRKRNYKDGVQHGLDEGGLLEEGKLSFKGNYKYGERDGPWVFYDRPTYDKETVTYKDGKVVGPWELYRDGLIVSRKTYVEGKENVLQQSLSYKDGKQYVYREYCLNSVGKSLDMSNCTE